MKKQKQQRVHIIWHILCLTDERTRLYERIDARRVDQMMEEGLLDEVKTLKDMGCCTVEWFPCRDLDIKKFLLIWMAECSLEEAVTYPETGYQTFCKTAAHLVSQRTSGCDLVWTKDSDTMHRDFGMPC